MPRAMNDHGWVERRNDGTKADCGGPFVCESCTADLIEAVHSEVNPFYSLMVRTIDRLGKRVFHLEHPWIEARAQRQRMIESEAKTGLQRLTEELAQETVVASNIVLEPKAENAKTLLRHGGAVEALEGNVMGYERIVWDAAAFAEIAARMKDAEARLDKLEQPQGERPQGALPQGEGDANLRRRVHELGLHIKARQGEIERLLARIAELEKNRDAEYNRAEYALSKAQGSDTANKLCRAEISKLNGRIAELERENTDLQAFITLQRAIADNFKNMLGKG